MFVRAFARKQHHAMRRYRVINNTRYYIPVSELILLAGVYLRTGFKCWYCGRKMEMGNDNDAACSIDHRIPLSKGGVNAIENIVYCCHACNTSKGSEIYERSVGSDNPSGTKKEPNVSSRADRSCKGLEASFRESSYCQDEKKEPDKSRNAGEGYASAEILSHGGI
jgi:5-methylcytosine-specific restriction endonuclease McrA